MSVHWSAIAENNRTCCLSPSDYSAHGRLANIQDSLERIQSRQQESSDKIEAMQQVEADFSPEPSNKFREADKPAQEILERIKASAAS